VREREIRATLTALREAGSPVDYVSVDVRDEAAFTAAIAAIYDRHGRLDAVIHGAGVIEDKLIGDKTPQSFDRVVLTKADSAFVLARALRPDTLRALVFMASVSATYGNRGQADYAAANGVLNGLASMLSAQWPGRVVSMNWGPWDKVGMVTPEVRRQFLENGIHLVPPDAGAEAVLCEMSAGGRADPVVVIGDGPWVHEADRLRALEPAV
jgi:NAD(P)-dependent dehydrogenase (short-subunit alcohol dehydrogenase family)